MSGGHFDYNQYHIREIADKIEDIIVKCGVEVKNIEHQSWEYDENGNLYPWYKYHYYFPDDIIEKMKEGYWKLREAEIFAQRIDWLISGDDGEDSFRNRLKNEMEILENEKNIKTWEYYDRNDE